MAIGLIMAGGLSSRMRASGFPGHKALAPALGVPLLERNLVALLSAGVRDIIVAVRAEDTSVEAYVSSRGRALVEARGAHVECHREFRGLGTIGAAGALTGRGSAVLVLNVDNLSAIDLRKLVQFHEHSDALLTIATHREPFQMPFGELVISGGCVSDYREKPVHWTTISSGTYVLSAAACGLIPSDQRTDVPDLVRLLIDRGSPVRAFPHAAPWIDVNDTSTLNLAERLISDHREQFERWTDPPALDRVDLLVFAGSDTLVDRCRESNAWGLPTLPWSVGAIGDTRPVLSDLVSSYDWEVAPDTLTVFDDLSTVSGLLTRHHVISGRLSKHGVFAQSCPAGRWLHHDDLRSSAQTSSLRRAIAWSGLRR